MHMRTTLIIKDELLARARALRRAKHNVIRVC